MGHEKSTRFLASDHEKQWNFEKNHEITIFSASNSSKAPPPFGSKALAAGAAGEGLAAIGALPTEPEGAGGARRAALAEVAAIHLQGGAP